jgi:serine/threonine-protein kinase
MQLSPGTRLNGIYEIDTLIAAGGMGEIYKGHTVQTSDTVAIKILLPEFAENEAALALFRREASALHNLHHEAIVRYYVFTIEPALGRPYLAMEFVEGQSLADIVRREPLTYEAVRSLVKRVASGLHAAHERGIIHRDVSSDNIMIPVGDVGRAKIIDFGIARSTQLVDRTIIGGGFAGKYNYVSPEQLGLFGGEVQAKSDIYSLGLVLVEALTGQPIDMGGSQAQILDKRRKAPDLGYIDLRIRPLIEKMLQPDPAARPDSMAQVATWPLPTSRPGEAHSPDDRRRNRNRGASPSGSRKWTAIAAVALLLIGGAAGAAYYLTQRGTIGVREPPAPPLLGEKKQEPSTKLGKADTAPGPALTPSGGAPPSAAPTPAPPPAAKTEPPGPSLTPARPPVSSSPAQPASPSPASKGNTEIAALPPPSGSRAQQIQSYINQYDGGDCFFITPTMVSANAARIDGYGATSSAFQVLDDAFKRTNGFEADIEVRQVTAAQCPAITFLGRLRHERARAPQLQIAQPSIRSGEAVTGSIDGVGSNSVQLLLVSDEGSVQDISALLKPSGDARTFNLRLQRTGAAGAQPQLLVAVVSGRPLATLQGAQSTPADQLFPLALTEAARTGQAIAASVRYFKLDL